MASLEIVYQNKMVGREEFGSFCEAKTETRIREVMQILRKTIKSNRIVELKYVSIYGPIDCAEITLRWPV